MSKGTSNKHIEEGTGQTVVWEDTLQSSAYANAVKTMFWLHSWYFKRWLNDRVVAAIQVNRKNIPSMQNLICPAQMSC